MQFLFLNKWGKQGMLLENAVDVIAEKSCCESECRRIVDELKSMILRGSLAADTKLQPEKKLAASFSSTVHVIRKALKQLREEGFLYSRPKFGVFVASRTTEGGSAADTSSLFQPVLDDCPETGIRFIGIRFITQSRLPEQLKLFSSAIEGFRKQFPFCNIDIVQSENGKGITHDISAETDIVETGIPFFYSRISEAYLPVREYFPGMLHFSEQDPAAVPCYYSTNYLCYNPEILAALKCPEPSYSDFNGQQSYLDEVTAKIQAHSMPLPGTCFSFLSLLGHFLHAMRKDFNDRKITEEEFVRRYREPITRCTSYSRKYGISFPRQADIHVKRFTAGETPFFFVDTSTVLQLRSFFPHLNFRIYPILSLDDTLPRLTVPFSIRRTTRHPVECVRFLRYLQSEPVQRKFAELGFIPLAQEHYHYLPIPMAASRKGAAEIFFATPEDFYVGINILNVELWNVILFGKSVENALKDAFLFARAYLSFQLDMKTRKLQSEHGNYFI